MNKNKARTEIYDQWTVLDGNEVKVTSERVGLTGQIRSSYQLGQKAEPAGKLSPFIGTFRTVASHVE